jgi:group I intron endonuclease
MYLAMGGDRGVYVIRCTDGRAYVGGSGGIKKRWGQHRRRLRGGRHENRCLQEAWSALGETAFTFEVLELVPTGDLHDAEQRHMDRLQAYEKGFNLSPTAGTLAGVSWSVETRARMAASAAARWADPAERHRLSLARKGLLVGEKGPGAKLTESQVLEIRQLARAGVLQREIAATYNVARVTVSHIITARSWRHLPNQEAAV